MLSLVIVMSTLSAGPVGYAERVLFELYQRDIELSRHHDPDYHPPRNVGRMTPSRVRPAYTPQPRRRLPDLPAPIPVQQWEYYRNFRVPVPLPYSSPR